MINHAFSDYNLQTVQEFCHKMFKRFSTKVNQGKAPRYFRNILQKLQDQKRNTSRYFKVPACKNVIGQRSFQYRYTNLQNIILKEKLLVN